MVENSYLTGTCRTIANATLLAPVELFYDVCPDEVEDCRVVFCNNWVAEHDLFVVLVWLKVFRLVPIGPIILLNLSTIFVVDVKVVL